MAHGRGPEEVALGIAQAALQVARGLDEERAKLYADLVLNRLGIAAKAALEALMLSGRYEYQSDFAKKYVAQGKAEGEAMAVLTVLTARGIVVPVEVRERILACRDLEQLDNWIVRAVSVASVDELFA